MQGSGPEFQPEGYQQLPIAPMLSPSQYLSREDVSHKRHINTFNVMGLREINMKFKSLFPLLATRGASAMRKRREEETSSLAERTRVERAVSR